MCVLPCVQAAVDPAALNMGNNTELNQAFVDEMAKVGGIRKYWCPDVVYCFSAGGSITVTVRERIFREGICSSEFLQSKAIAKWSLEQWRMSLLEGTFGC